MRVRIQEETLLFTAHALERYQQRIRPHLTLHEAAADLRRLSVHATIGDRPEWAAWHPREGRWLLIGPSIAFPVDDYRVLTCLAQGCISDTWRQKRNRDRRRAPTPSGRGRRRAIDRRAA
jgi:hypothetical protein